MYQNDVKHTDPTMEDKLQRLYTLNRNKKIDLSFRPPYLELLEKFGQPHLNLPPVIHVAGTNGKGSIIAMLRAVLEEAGYKVHTYTSPHLVRFNERILLGGKRIEDGPLEELIDEALALNEDGELTFFEITTAMAFAAFASTPADICLLEVGMGGRLDCTNVIENPLLTIINTIAMDHSEYLGETLSEIAGEKAGIMKKGVPCVIGHQNDKSVMDVFESKAAGLNVTLHNADVIETPFETSLLGPHQKGNMKAALKALSLINDQFPVSDEHIENGLKNVHWPARLQRLDANTFGLQPATELYLDGGHNADAGLALAAQAKLWQEQESKPLSVILGMMQGKDAREFLKPLLPLIDNLYVVNIEGEPQSQNADSLAQIFPEAKAFETYKEALANIVPQTPHRILICGSLYLAGQVLQDAEK